MADNTLPDDARLSQTVMQMPGQTRQEGTKQDPHGRVENAVMGRDSSNLDQKKIRRTWMAGGSVHYSIGGQEVSSDQYFGR